MNDAGNLGPVERLARVQLQQHRCGRRLVVAQEAGVFRQRQVNACAGDRRQRLDRARQLAFQATLIVQLLLELGQPEFLPLEQLEADDGALWKTLRSQLKTRLVHLVGRHQNGAAVGVAVRDVQLRQLRDHGAAVAIGQVGEQHAVAWRGAPQPRGADDRYQAGRAQDHQGAGARREPGHQANRSRHRVGRTIEELSIGLWARTPARSCALRMNRATFRLFGDLRYRKRG